ncbi:hypothetical protein [Marinilabilia salmonicolor]|jgi:hypothetical protein|uniref:Uncharacterized protein n=1 Tax=Marinilabilia salmonicolor TaxID=989 RepID=A0A2T0XH77_9BACT|nr:hypothetical protein [Marinilabilia salmonicolor]PRY98296.1 hypothetical protein BY457_110108 [Marinilabilia salmonicolor]RCW33870.1 hypothetical protein DFO77_11232 [Marinilabilia salmonicolor]
MGLSFHYSGAIKNREDLPSLIADVQTLAKTHDWEYQIFETSFPDNEVPPYNEDLIYGISITPPKCETIDICFTQDGRMSSLLHLLMWKDSDPAEAEKYMYLLSVKTQFAGIDIHVIVIDFFRYISRQYLKNFTLTDEGNYWETSDMQVLKNQFDRFSRALDSFGLGLETTPPESKENLINYLERIAKKTDNFLKREDDKSRNSWRKGQVQ